MDFGVFELFWYRLGAVLLFLLVVLFVWGWCGLWVFFLRLCFVLCGDGGLFSFGGVIFWLLLFVLHGGCMGLGGLCFGYF